MEPSIEHKTFMVLLGLGMIAILGTSLFIGGVAFSNPDMTQQRIIITYWKEILIGFGSGIAFLFFADRVSKKSNK